MGNFKAFLEDNIEKAAIACLGISASGWMTFVMGFGSQLVSFDPVINALEFVFVPWYVATAVGPLVFVLVGLYLMLGKYFKISMILQSFSVFFIIVYIGALAAPVIFLSALILSAGGGIDEVVDTISIPDLISLGVVDSIFGGAGNGLLTGFIRALLYLILILLFDQFISGIKAQLIGSLTSIVFLGLTMILWPFIRRQSDREKIC